MRRIAIPNATSLACCLLACAALWARAQGLPAPSVNPKAGGEYKANLLYTPPSPDAQGGLHLVSSLPLEMALAIPENNQEHVYKGTLGPDNKDVTFSNIPVSRYDLVLVTTDHLYEGISLNRDENSLSEQDVQSINDILWRSVPFFNVKRIDAVKGTPGDAGRSTALVQWMRIGGVLLNQNYEWLKGHQIRSVRLAFLADVGPGWQVTGTRELVRTDVFPNMMKGYLATAWLDDLNGVRVTDSVKDIGKVNLGAATEIAPAVAEPSASPLPTAGPSQSE